MDTIACVLGKLVAKGSVSPKNGAGRFLRMTTFKN